MRIFAFQRDWTQPVGVSLVLTVGGSIATRTHSGGQNKKHNLVEQKL
jgi:hypothetical protein